MPPSGDHQRYLPLKPKHFHILLTLVDEPMHGYGIRHDIERRTDGRLVLAAGTLYETLQRLERDGLIVETPPPDDLPEQASSRWRFFVATPLGRRVLTAEVARLEADIEAARAKIPATG